MRKVRGTMTLVVLSMVAMSLSSCSPSYDSVAVGLGKDGAIRVIYAPCPGDQIENVDLVKWEDDSSTSLWEISNDAGSSQDEFVVGETPTGWAEEFAFEGALSPSAENFTVGVEASDQDGTDVSAFETFRPEELRVDQVRSQAHLMTEAAFLEDRADDCGPSGRTSTGEKAIPKLITVFVVLAVAAGASVAFAATWRRKRSRRSMPARPDGPIPG